VNACRQLGERQGRVIFFTAPSFDGEKLVQPVRVTIFHNGVLMHLNQEICGETGHRILPEYRQKTSKRLLSLAGHNCPLRFPNIWLRPL
jgi:hypothetical protein